MDSYIIFNNKNSLDEGFKIISYNLGAPTPKIVTETVPHMNGVYDFSMINGVQYYNSRTIDIEFDFKYFTNISRDTNSQNIYKKYFEFKSFLLSSGKTLMDITGLLKFKGIVKAKCINVSGIAQGIAGGSFVATFTCDPFINIGDYGDQLWDPFSFIDGMTEFNKVQVNGEMTIPIYNQGQPTKCSIETTGTVELQNLSNNFMIQTGITNLNVTGIGTVTINFIKEVI